MAELIWRVDDADLSAGDARVLRAAVDAVAYWLELWSDITGEGRRIALGVAGTALSPAGPGLPAALLDAVLSGLVLLSSGEPPHIPAGPEPDIGEDIDSQPSDALSVTLSLLEPDEMIVAGNLTFRADSLTAFHELDDYVFSRVDQTGAASVDDAEVGFWTIVLR